MIIVEGQARIPEDRWPEAKSAMEEMIRASRAEVGCIDYAYAVDLLDANMLRVIERWESREALRDHFQTPHMARFRSALAAIGPTDVAVRMYESDQEQLPL